MIDNCYLHDFTILRPPYEADQEYGLQWLISAHTKAESVKNRQNGTPFDEARFREEITNEMQRVACKPPHILKRGYTLTDFKHQNWEEMLLYRLEEAPQGVGLQKRTQIQEKFVDGIFEHFYPDASSPPDDLIHVSCTGYSSPSGGQKIAAKHDWGNQVTVTHAYHMGCYASIPAIRMGKGFALSGKEIIDVVHTEFASIHFNPLLHQPDQLVSQSLFADGFVKYSVSKKGKNGPSLRILGIHELMVPKTQEEMRWVLTEWGFHLTLSKEIPFLIARFLKKHFQNLCEKANVTEKEILDSALFAIHPGGPKVVENVKRHFRCSQEQIKYSEAALQNWGNMSSSTLPHIWSQICADPQVGAGTKIFSLAFGPGVTIAGVILEKVE